MPYPRNPLHWVTCPNGHVKHVRRLGVYYTCPTCAAKFPGTPKPGPEEQAPAATTTPMTTVQAAPPRPKPGAEPRPQPPKPEQTPPVPARPAERDGEEVEPLWKRIRKPPPKSSS